MNTPISTNKNKEKHTLPDYQRGLIAGLADQLRFQGLRIASRCEALERAAADASPDALTGLVLEIEGERCEQRETTLLLAKRIADLDNELKKTTRTDTPTGT